MTIKEKVKIYEDFFHQMQMHIEVVPNQTKVNEALGIISSWSYSHRIGNGELTNKMQKKLINSQTKRMKDYK